MDDTKLRLFTALELPESWHRALGRLRDELERVAPGDLKLVRTELIHLTLVFLGYQPRDALESIDTALTAAAASIPSFPMTLGEVGFFGSPGAIRVIWVGLKDLPAPLQALHQMLTSQLANRGIPFDKKPLVPHITLARSRIPLERAVSLRIHAVLQKMRTPPGLGTMAEEFVLMESRLSPAGPDYRVVSRFPLRSD